MTVYNKYDNIVVQSINELIKRHEINKGIVLSNFDKKKISHLYFFEIARMVDSFSEGFTCVCKVGFWERLLHKKYYRIIKNSAAAPNFDIDNFLQTIVEQEGEEISTIENIYNTYYRINK